MIKRFLEYQIKAIEFKYQTWVKRRDINKAYASSTKFPNVFKFLLLGIIVLGMIIVVMKFITNDTSKRVVKHNKINNVQSVNIVSDTAINDTITKDVKVKKNKKDQIVINDTVDIKDTLVPNPYINISQWEPKKRMRFVILANKKTKQFYLLRRSYQTWSVYRQYPVAIGENSGKKQLRGDKKTPEGMYFIIGRKEGRELPNIYGPMAFVLNYPNREDIKAGRTGQGIWIHGTKPDTIPLQTKGCLELDNRNLSELSKLLKVGIGVAVLIVSEDSIQNPPEFPNYEAIRRERRIILSHHQNEQQKMVVFLGNWSNAWQTENIKEYSNFYDQQNFFSIGLHWDGWLKRKIGTFKKYKKISVTVDRVILTDFSKKTAEVKFIQEYSSDNFEVKNGKKLLLNKINGRWRIYSESTYPQEEHLL